MGLEISNDISFFKYKGINKRGDNKLSGIIVAKTELEATNLLKSREIYATFTFKKQETFINYIFMVFLGV